MASSGSTQTADERSDIVSVSDSFSTLSVSDVPSGNSGARQIEYFPIAGPSRDHDAVLDNGSDSSGSEDDSDDDENNVEVFQPAVDNKDKRQRWRERALEEVDYDSLPLDLRNHLYTINGQLQHLERVCFRFETAKRMVCPGQRQIKRPHISRFINSEHPTYARTIEYLQKLIIE